MLGGDPRRDGKAVNENKIKDQLTKDKSVKKPNNDSDSSCEGMAKSGNAKFNSIVIQNKNNQLQAKLLETQFQHKEKIP